RWLFDQGLLGGVSGAVAGDGVARGASVAEGTLYFSTWPSSADFAASSRALESQRSGSPQDSHARASSRWLPCSATDQIDRPLFTASMPWGAITCGLAFSAASTAPARIFSSS